MTDDKELQNAIRNVLENHKNGCTDFLLTKIIKKNGINTTRPVILVQADKMFDVCEKDDGKLCLIKFLEERK